MSRPSRLVADATLWIDLAAAGLTAAAFRLPVTWLTPDVIIDRELRDPPGSRLEALGLERIEFTSSQVARAVALKSRYTNLSLEDAFALLAARHARTTLVTGDAVLRKAACREGVDCHGTLWLLEWLVDDGILAPAAAVAALQGMVDAGSRFPDRDCARLIKRWRAHPS
jgi:predicted nucleic acid-binding protein